MEEMDDDDDDEGNERELKIRTFGEALSVVSDLQEFAASKKVPELLELMQDAKEIIQRSLVKKSRQFWKTCGDRETRRETAIIIRKLKIQ